MYSRGEASLCSFGIGGAVLCLMRNLQIRLDGTVQQREIPGPEDVHVALLHFNDPGVAIGPCG